MKEKTMPPRAAAIAVSERSNGLRNNHSPANIVPWARPDRFGKYSGSIGDRT
jgi:hypothetical protein